MEKSEKLNTKDPNFEGKDKAFVDVDRMINEGLSGGDVHPRYGTTNIEEAHKITEQEAPPYESK